MLLNSCLDGFEGVVWRFIIGVGLGMPPRNPLGILKTLIVKRIRNIPSDRELYRYRASVERVISRLKHNHT